MKSAYTGFLFGNYPELSFLELEAVLKRFKFHETVKLLTPELGLVSPNPALYPLIETLGGTVKIGELHPVSRNTLIPVILADLSKNHQTKACFYSSTPGLSSSELAKTVKTEAKKESINLHFRLPESLHNTAGVGKAWSDYIYLEDRQRQGWLFITRSVQNLSHWSQKDYGRPLASPKKGMLPPKIARMLVNLGLDDREPESLIFYDPFCGTGTLLLEAMDLKFNRVLGSDISSDQIRISQANCDWYAKIQNYPPPNYQCFVKDIMALSLEDIKTPVDAIVFEGYLGPPSLASANIPGQVKGLTKMYHGVFKRLKPLLKSQGKLVCALPAYIDEDGRIVTLKPLIDTCEKLGYTFTVPPLIVGRPHALIKREIYILSVK